MNSNECVLVNLNTLISESMRLSGIKLDRFSGFSKVAAGMFVQKAHLLPIFGARRLAESARHLVQALFRARSVRPWMPSVFRIRRLLLAINFYVVDPVAGIVHRVIVD